MNPAPLHGGDVHQAARELGKPLAEILDFSASLNPLGPPPGLLAHLAQNLEAILHYPPPRAGELTERLAALHGLEPASVLAGNGSTQLIHLVCRVLRPRRPLIFTPAFAEYEKGLLAAGLSPLFLPCPPADGFTPSRQTAEAALEMNPDALFLANPASPSGRLVAPGVLKLLVKRTAATGARLILDEAFLDLTPGQSLAPLARDHENLIVLRSLTKSFAMPGLRLGYLAAGGGTAARLTAGTAPWTVNTLAALAGLFCLESRGYLEESREFIAGQRRALEAELDKLGFRVLGGAAANYLMARPPGDAARLAHGLRLSGLLVRDCSSFRGLESGGWLRLAVRAAAENKRLIKMLAAGGD